MVPLRIRESRLDFKSLKFETFQERKKIDHKIAMDNFLDQRLNFKAIDSQNKTNWDYFTKKFDKFCSIFFMYAEKHWLVEIPSADLAASFLWIYLFWLRKMGFIFVICF